MEEESLLFKEKGKCAEGDGDFEHATSHTRKISKKWTAKHKRELEEKYEKETVTEIPEVQKSLLQKQRPSMKKFFSRPKKALEGKSSVDGLPKSPSGRLTKYFS